MQNYMRLVVFVTLLCCSLQSDLPSDFQKCKRSGDDFNGCLKGAIQDALPKCDNGFPDFGVPKLQPLNVPEATLGDANTGAVRVVQHYSDINLYNLTRTKLDKVKAIITETDFKLIMEGVMPDLKWDSNYDFNGQILLLPVSGKGKCYIKFKRVRLNLSFIGEIYDSKGEKYIKINTAKIDFNPEDFNIQLTNLFNGDERLGGEVNKVVNENWREAWADLKPDYEKLFETVLLDYMNRICKNVPLNIFFPL